MFQMYNNNQTMNESAIELVAYSEQIMNEEQEIAPGIPTQDQVFRQLRMIYQQQQYPEGAYVNMLNQLT